MASDRYRLRLEADLYDKVRMAAEVHRQVRKYAQSFIKPGIKLADMCEMIENKNRELIQVSQAPLIVLLAPRAGVSE